MAPGAKAYQGMSEDELNRAISIHRIILIALFLLSILVGLATFSICIWVRFDLDFWQWVISIEWYSYWYAMYPTLIAMVIVICLSVSGLYGCVSYVRFGWLSFVMWSMVFMFFFHIICAAVITVWGVEESSVLTNELSEVFLRMVYNWDDEAQDRHILGQIMEYVGCCAADGSDDFINIKKEVPYECRDRTTGCEWAYGCQQGLAWWLEPWTGFLAAANCAFLLSDLFGVIVIKRFTSYCRAYDEMYGGYD